MILQQGLDFASIKWTTESWKSKNEEQHKERFQLIERPRQHGINLNQENCIFGAKKVIFMNFCKQI